MSAIGELLFYNQQHAGVDDHARHHQSKAGEYLERVSQSVFDAKSDDEVVAMVVQDMLFDPLVVDFESAKPSVEETNIEARSDFGFGGSATVPAFKVTKAIPFTGDGGFWTIMVGQWSSSMPRGKVRGKTLIVGMTVPAQRADEAKAYLDRTINEIKEYVALHWARVDAYNASLPGIVRPLVEARRKRRSQAADLLAKL